MTQNKTELQKALKNYSDRRTVTFLKSKGFFMESKDIETIVKAAQNYADLPSKIKVKYVQYTGNKREYMEERVFEMLNEQLDDILNLLKDNQ